MKQYKNSPKRYYFKNKIYSVTTCTWNKDPFFEEDIFCELFIQELNICKEIKKFKLYGYKINPDHVHMIIKPGDKANISEIMRSIKTNFSRDANRVILPKIGDDPNIGEVPNIGKVPRPRLYLGIPDSCQFLEKFHCKYHKKYPNKNFYPKFKWQRSFWCHIINSEKELINQIKYLEKQWIKHGLNENKWLYIMDGFIV